MTRSGSQLGIRESKQNSNVAAIAATLIVGVGLGLGMSAMALFLSKRKCKSKEDNIALQATSMEQVRALPQDRDLIPPLPHSLIDLLHRQATCQLATVDHVHNAPHLSQMRFTYVDAYNVLVFSTRRNTAKFENLQKNKQLAAIFHNENISVTVYGSLEIDGEDAEILRAEHLRKNKGYEQFIVGDQIAIIAVRIKRARICNINDQVSEWVAS